MRKLKNKKKLNFFEKTLFITYSSLFICEVLSIKFYFFGKLGVFLWFFSWLLLLIYIGQSLIKIFKKPKVFIIILFLSFFALINTINPSNLSGETTQQIAGTLNYFKNSNDFGFRETIMFGYPARQFFLPAIFSLIFGRNQFFLNFGGCLYYIFALIIFSKGLIDFFSNNKYSEIFTGLILSFIPHLYWTNHFIFYYEQSFFPFAFGLMLIGLFLSYLKNSSKIYLFLIGFVIDYLIFSYTPGIAVVFFFLLIGIYSLLFSNDRNKKFLLLIFFISLIFLLSSFQFRRDINIGGEEMTKDLIIKNLSTAFRHLVFMDQGKPIVSPFFQLIFLLTIFYSIINLKNLKVFFSGWWIILAIIFSIISKGYSYYGIDFRFHRASIIFPIIFLLITIFLKNLKINLNKKTLLVILYFFLISGFFFQWDLLNKREPSRHLYFINRLREKVKEKYFPSSSKLIISDEFYYQYLSLNDALQYFLPEFSYIFLNQYLNDYSTNLEVDQKNLIFVLTSMEKEKYQNLLFKKRLVDYFVFNSDKPLFLYK